MAEEYCKSAKTMCDPAGGCNHEFCWWRDNVWALQQLKRWAYSTSNEKPVDTKQTSDGKTASDQNKN